MAIPTYGATVALRSSKLSSGRGGAESSSRQSTLTPRPGGPGHGVRCILCRRWRRAPGCPTPGGSRTPYGETRSRQHPTRPAQADHAPARDVDHVRCRVDRPLTAPPPRPAGLTDAELARAAELEAQLVAEEQAAQNARRRSQERSTAAREISATPVTALDDAREYAYVARDLKDIARIAILLLIVLFVLYIAIDVTGVFKIH